MRTISLGLLFLFLLNACGMQHPVQTAYHNAQRPQTPPEFYSQAVPASFSPTGSSNRAESSDSTFPETKSEKHHAAVIGVLAGVLVVAGAVVPIVLIH